MRDGRTRRCGRLGTDWGDCRYDNSGDAVETAAIARNETLDMHLTFCH